MKATKEDLHESGKPLSKEEFINKIKTDAEFAEKWGELGPVYGKQWRSWETRRLMSREDVVGEPQSLPEYFEVNKPIDQIQNLINDLKTNPDSRRLMVNAWNVGEIDNMVLPPCHYGFQVYTRELSLEERCDEYIKIHPKETNDGVLNYKWIGDNLCSHEDYDKWNVPTRAISLMFNMRSCDTFLGLPFNIASYGLLLEIIAKAVNMVPDELIGNLGDVHLYSNHVDQAKEQIGRELTIEERKKIYEEEFTPGIEVSNDIWLESKLTTRNIPERTREPYPLPTLNIKLHFNNEPSFVPEQWLIDDFELIGYKAHPTIKAPLSN